MCDLIMHELRDILFFIEGIIKLTTLAIVRGQVVI